jgi:hypothetical protein
MEGNGAGGGDALSESGRLIEDVKPSPDGRELAFARGRRTADVWILELKR